VQLALAAAGGVGIGLVEWFVLRRWTLNLV
jgi:hypothetical protein